MGNNGNVKMKFITGILVTVVIILGASWGNDVKATSADALNTANANAIRIAAIHEVCIRIEEKIDWLLKKKQ